MGAPTMEELYQSASMGDAGAMVEYGRHLLYGIDCDVNMDQAVSCFSQAAGLGNGEAARELGYCCSYGTGTAKNDQMATEWFRKGAELGDAESMYKLFQNLSIGIGCSASNDEADSWLEKAKDLGYGRAQETYKSFSDRKLLSYIMEQKAQPKLTESTSLADENIQAGSLEKMVPSTSFDLKRIADKDTAEPQIVSSDYQESSATTNSTGLMILIYTVFGAVSGYLISRLYSAGNAVLNIDKLSDYIRDSFGITFYLVVLGGVFGLLLGFIISRAYEFSSNGMLFYLPVLVLPYLILMAAFPILSFVSNNAVNIGKTVLAIVEFALTIWTICTCCTGTSNG